MNLALVLEERAAERGWSDRPAVILHRGALSHHDVHDGAARTASLLAGLGVRRGDRVLMALADGPAFAWAFLAAVRMGALAVPVNPQLPASDHRALVADCGPAAVVCDDHLAGRFVGPVVQSGSMPAVLQGLGRHPAAPAGPEAAAYAQYTSGTTGAPRAAVHRHGDPLVFSAAFAEPILRLGPGDVVLSVSKAYFAYGIGNSLFFPLLTGAGAVLHPSRPSPEEVARLVRRHQVTALFAVPTFYANLIRSGCRPAAFASLRVAVSAGERLPPHLAAAAEQLLGCPLLDSLGTTEVGQAFVAGSVSRRRPGTIGQALPPYEVAVRGEDGAERPAGRPGLLWVRGPTTLLEYLGQPDATAAAYDGRWICTGDLASLDDDGFLSHHGRADDMEMVGGISVAPQEIEEVIGAHPAVAEVAVAGVADADGASRLEAFVVVANDVAAGDDLGRELTRLVRERLAPYKVPRAVTFVGALPRTPTGKLRRFVLRSGRCPAPAGGGAPSPAAR